MSVDYKAYLLVGYEVEHSYCDDESAESYLLNPNYYFDADKCYFGKVIGEVDAGYGTAINVDTKTYEEVCKELFNAKSKIDNVVPTSMPYPNMYLICAIH